MYMGLILIRLLLWTSGEKTSYPHNVAHVYVFAMYMCEIAEAEVPRFVLLTQWERYFIRLYVSSSRLSLLSHSLTLFSGWVFWFSSLGLSRRWETPCQGCPGAHGCLLLVRISRDQGAPLTSFDLFFCSTIKAFGIDTPGLPEKCRSSVPRYLFADQAGSGYKFFKFGHWDNGKIRELSEKLFNFENYATSKKNLLDLRQILT